MPSLTANTQAASLMTGSMLFFVLGDVCIKALAGDMPLSQILVLRGVLATLFMHALARALGQWRLRLTGRDARLVAARSVAEAGAAFFFLTGLFALPLANATAILQTLPLTVTLGAALVLREPVGWRRWAAIAVGFCGMLLIVKPGSDGFNSASLLVLAAVLCVTARDLITRRLSPMTPSLTVAFWSMLGITLFGAALSLTQEWVPLTPRPGGILVLATLFSLGAFSMSVMTMRLGEASFSAPFRYSSLVFALILGWLVFGDWPDGWTLIGAAIVAATGVFTLWREAQAKRRRT